MLSETLRTRWFSLCLHAGLWLLLVLAIIGSRGGGNVSPFGPAAARSRAVIAPVPVARLKLLFTATNQPGTVVDPAAPNLFKTSYFVPAPQPLPAKPVPAPPPPTTQKIALTYQGYYRTGDGPKYALLKLGDNLVRIPVGGMVVTNLFVVDAELRTLTLTNTAVQTNLLNLNARQVVEVPL